MKEKTITVLKVEPMKKPELVTIKNELEDLQDAVSIGADYRGLIEGVGIEPGVDFMLNDEGKMIGLPPNRYFADDILCGVFYVVGVDGEHFCSLAQDKIEKYSKMFEKAHAFFRFGDSLLIEEVDV